MIGLITPSEGRITVLGKDLSDLDADEAHALRRRWGILFQSGALFSSLTVAENVALPLREHCRLSPELVRELVALKLGLAGLPADAGDKYPSELSGGMRKRRALPAPWRWIRSFSSSMNPPLASTRSAPAASIS